MPETTQTSKPEVHHPATVGSTFMRQYYHFLAKEPASLHRFYKDESTWCHGVGSHMQEAISGQKAIKDEIPRRGYAGARVDLDIGSIDCQASLHGGVFVLVTGVMTLTSSPVPKPFVQTFFLAVQPNGYFVLNDCLRFLELPGASPASLAAPSAADAAVAPTDVKKQPTQAAIGTPVAAASPAAKSKPVTPRAAAVKKDKVPASPAAKPVETPASPVKIATPVKVASPKATPVAAPASPVKKAAPAQEKTTPKPSETKPATPASPALAKPVSTPASPAPAPAQPVVPAPAKPAEPVAPAAPKTWAALFTPGPAATAAPAAPAVAPKAAAPAKATPASPAPAAAADAAAAKPAETAAAPAQEKEKKRYSSLYIRDIPPQTKEAEVRELFKPYGAIAKVTVPTGRGFAFVDYFEEESMRAALADGKEFKLHDKVIHVDERSERKDKDRSFRTDGAGGRGGRGLPKGGRSGDRKEREDGKERRGGDREAGAANGKPAAANGPRANANGDRREKGGRRSGKEDGAARGTSN